MKKRKPLRKVSKSKVTIKKADRALQDWYRAKYPNKRCECCGMPFQVMHHHVEKSKSNAGRFLDDNLIFLCHKCHSSIHFQNHNVVAIYSARRGEAWVQRMIELKQVRRLPYGKKELEEIIEKYRIEPSVIEY